MNNLTHKLFLALFFMATCVSSWASETTTENDIPSSKRTKNLLPPAPPTIRFVNVNRCGFQVPGANVQSMSALLEGKCSTGQAAWYNVTGGPSLGTNNAPNDGKLLEISRDITVYAVCVENGETSLPSASLFVQYKAAPQQPIIINQTNKLLCEGDTTIITVAGEKNYGWTWYWERSKGVDFGMTSTFDVNYDGTTSGQGTPFLKITKAGWYYLSIVSPDCPATRVPAPERLFVDSYRLPKPVVTASQTVFCEDQTVSLKADSSQLVAKYEWYVNGKKQDSLGTRSNVKAFGKPGSVQVIAIDNRQSCKSALSDAVVLKTLRVPPKPIIIPSKRGAAVCQGDTLSLTSSLGFKYKWSTGATTPDIKNISTVGKYTVQVIDTSGCVSKASDTTTITIFRLPTKPVISASGPLAFCSGGNVTLTSSPNTTYIWNNRAVTRAITINASGDFTVAVRDANLCLSPTSDIAKVIVYALPAKPTITASSSLSFCADQSVILTGSDLPNSERTRYRWNTTDSTKSLTVKTSATFTLRVLDPRNCLSPSSDPVSTIALPLPPAPTVTADGPITFCSRSNDDYTKPNSVNLTASPVGTNTLTWSTGFVGRTLALTAIGADGKFVDISRDYTVTSKDATTGCISPKSIPIIILVKNNPELIVGLTPPDKNTAIIKDGTFTLKAVNFPDGSDYEWRFGTEILKFTDGSIKANRYGDYSARRKTVFTVPAPTSTISCFSDFVKLDPPFKENPEFKGLSIYPNPSNGLLTIETLADYDNPELIIYDLLGRLIYTGTVPTIKGKLIVDLRNQVEGEYMLRFKASGFDLTKRIIIDR